MAIPLKIGVENPDEILNAGLMGPGALIEIQSSTLELTGYAAIAGTGSTPTIPIQPGVRSYTGYDPQGSFGQWYRTRYRSADNARVSVDWATDALWFARPGHAPFQVGDETAGLLVSLYDVNQRMSNNNPDPNRDELLLEIIRGVSDEIEDYTKTWLAPRPADPASTMTLTFDVEETGRELYLKSGGRRVGIRSLTALEYAYFSQPQTGGVYASATLANVLLRPQPTTDAPASRLVLSDLAPEQFYAGYNTLRATGSFGPARVAPRIQEVAFAAITRRWLGKDTAAAAIALGPDGGVRLLADIPPGMVAILDRIRPASVS